MKTKHVILTLSTVVLAGSLMLTSCRKKTREQEQPDSDQTAAQENQIAENMMSDVGGIGSQGAETGTLSTYRLDANSDVFGVTSGSISFGTKSFTIDFGAYPGVTCIDGRKRSGKLMFDYSISTNTIMPIYYRTPGFKMSITSANYTVDDYTVAAMSKTITNTTPMSIPTGTNPGIDLTWNIVANVTLNKPASAGGGTITWNCNRTKTLANTSDPLCYGGQSVPINWNKAKVQLDGTATGVTAANENYTAVMTALTRNFGTCGAFLKYPFISGQLDFTPGTKYTRYIDFGSGTCDRAATVKINNITYSFNF